MTDFYLPSQLEPSESRFDIIDNTARTVSPLTGYTRTVARPGERARLALNFRTLAGAKRAALHAFLAGMRGAAHRIWSHDHSYQLRGSFPATELLANNTFASGVGAWTCGSAYTISVVERVLRAQRNAVTAAANLLVSETINLTQYAPHVARAIVIPGRGDYVSGLTARVVEQLSPTAAAFGMSTNVCVPIATTGVFRIQDNQASSLSAGDFVLIPWVSLARCALVDNGPNLLRHAEDLTQTTWQKTNSSVSADATAAPDGLATADSLVEDSTASSLHYVNGQFIASAAVDDYCFAVALKAGARTWARVTMLAGSSSVNTYVNLSTGAFGASGTGGNWSNLRRFVANLGNGWFYVAILARKTSADTTLAGRVQLATGDTADSYSGNGSSNIYVWRPTLANSAVPVRLTNNGATANADGDLQPQGGGIHTKGWPVSTSGLLLPGDQVQIGNQILHVSAPVDSDAAGRAFLPLGQSIRIAPTDNAPVIINQPMAKFMLDSESNGWINVPGLFSDSEIALVEAA